MLAQEYRHLIDTLKSKTDTGAISWLKGDSRFSYQAKTKENTFKVDKYFAGDQNDACLNLSVYGKKGELLLEVVLCRAVGEQMADYEYLNDLYSRIELLVNDGNIPSVIPMVTSITQSLEQV